MIAHSGTALQAAIAADGDAISSSSALVVSYTFKAYVMSGSLCIFQGASRSNIRLLCSLARLGFSFSLADL